MALNARQQLFVARYLIHRNATRAAIEAGYSKKTARKIGSRLLTNVDVKAAIARGQEKAIQRCESEADEVLRELRRIGKARLKDVLKWGKQRWELIDSDELDDDTAAAIESITFVESSSDNGRRRSVRVKMHSKPAALKLLGDHHGLFKEKPTIDEFLDALPESVRGPMRQLIAQLIAQPVQP